MANLTAIFRDLSPTHALIQDALNCLKNHNVIAVTAITKTHAQQLADFLRSELDESVYSASVDCGEGYVHHFAYDNEGDEYFDIDTIEARVKSAYSKWLAAGSPDVLYPYC